MLDSIHNQGLRLCLGAFRISPVESLYVDAHEPSLGARRAKLSLQYATKIKSLPKHPAHNAVFDNTYMKLFDVTPSAIFHPTTLGYQTTEDCAGFGASKKIPNRFINIPATFLGNSRHVP